MVNFPTEISLLDGAFCALTNLCYNNNTNKEKIARSGGAKQIIVCLLDNVNHADLLITG